jgi:peptidoglycan/xylan/chitin deacetylase (PgdA/CDA1 family)
MSHGSDDETYPRQGFMVRSHNKMMRPHNTMMHAHHFRSWLRDWLKLGLAAVVEHSGAGAAARALRARVAGPRIHVLGYHRVVERIDGAGPVNPSLCITVDTLRRQLDQLRQRFILLPLSSVVRAMRGELALSHDAAAVTFDDGYRDVLLRAAPVLRALDIPATVFVPTGFARPGGPARARRLPHDRLYAALWASARADESAARASDADEARAGDAETAELVARADRLVARAGLAAAVEDLIRVVPARALLRLIEALEPRDETVPADEAAPDGATHDNNAAPDGATHDNNAAPDGATLADEAAPDGATLADEAAPDGATHDDDAAVDDGAEVLAPDEVRALADAGWEIGAHTEGHVVLTHEPLDEVRRQLVTSKAELERWSGRRCRFFAYCNGYYSRPLIAELRRAGYDGAVTTCDRTSRVGAGDPFRIGRKVLSEAHARRPGGRFSPALSAAQLHDLFGALGLIHPFDGEVDPALAHPCAPVMVQSHNKLVVQSHNKPEGSPDGEPDDLAPTEVELVH